MNPRQHPRDDDSRERAETERLGDVLAALSPVLEKFNRFEGVDGASRRRAEWTAKLDTPLPREGAGLDVVVREQADVVIPNGVRNVHGRFAIRPCFINPRTTRADVELLARLVREYGDAWSLGS
jgi:hypothetical protein